MSVIQPSLSFIDQIGIIPDNAFELRDSQRLLLHPNKHNINKNLLFNLNTSEMEIGKPYKINDELAIIKIVNDEVYIIDMEPDL